jgi:hypothetical protein
MARTAPSPVVYYLLLTFGLSLAVALATTDPELILAPTRR